MCFYVCMCVIFLQVRVARLGSGRHRTRPIPVFIDIGLVFEMLGSFFGSSNLVFAYLLSVFLLCANSVFGYIIYVKAAGLVDFFVGVVECGAVQSGWFR